MMENNRVAITAIQPVQVQALLPPHPMAVVPQADDDAHLIELWLFGKSPNTRDAYRRDIGQFVDFVDLPLQSIRLGDVQAYAQHLEALGLAPLSRSRKLSAVKSLFSFGHRLGYLIYNVGAAVALPKAQDRLAERILDEGPVQRLLAVADASAPLRDRVLLRLFYASGARVSELAGLRWRDVQPRVGKAGREAGQVSLFGKGGKTRVVLLSPAAYSLLDAYRQEQLARGLCGPNDAVFCSLRGDAASPLSRQQLWRVVKRWAAAAGLPEAVSPHWLRHAHVSHALDRGAPAHLVQHTVGHASLATTSKYAHARPDASSSEFLAV